MSILCRILALTLVLLNQLAHSQQLARIGGRVTNSQQEAVVGATVTLYRAATNTLIKATFADAEGRFEFENLKPDSCVLKVSFVGLNTHTAPLLVSATDIQLPTITLTESTNALKEVSVSATKPFVEQKIDRMVINPDALIGNAGTTSLEVLEKAPGVMVDQNGNISFKGKAGVMVFIDNKPTYLSAADLANYLRSIPSANIESIELMTNPPAKYDAAGNAGVINIRLKKNIAKGFNGGLNLAYGQGRFMRTNNSFTFNYRISKFNFFTNLSFNQNNSYQDLTIERRYFTPDGRLASTFIQNSYIRPEVGSRNAKVGVDYYVSQKTTLGLALSGFHNPSTRTVNNNAEVGNAQAQLTGLVEAFNPANTRFTNNSVNLNFTHKFDNKGHELSGNIDNINYHSLTEQTLTNSNFTANRALLSQTVLGSSLPADINIKAAKLDYTHPVAKGGRLEAGAKTSFVHTGNVADFFDVLGSIQRPNYEFSNNFQYDENINAAYLNYSRDFKKVSVQMGLRLENTNIKGQQLGNPIVKDSSFTRQYTNLFPTFYVQYRPDSTMRHVWGLSVGRRIDRPNYKDMNPFTYPLDRFTYYGGNPFLQPTFAYNVQLTHTFKNFLTTALEFSQANNVISETNEQRGSIYYSRPGNFAKQIAYGISVNGAFKPTKWWTIQLYTTVMNNTFKSTIYGQILDESRFYWVFQPVNQFQINTKWSAELAGNYQSKILSGQFLVIPIWSVRAGLSTKIWKDKGSLKLNVSDFLYTNQVGGDIRNIANSAANWYSFLDTRVVTISLSYRFSKGQNLRVRQSGGSESEQRRVKS
jgi:iron complex outermembrane recepter protein